MSRRLVHAHPAIPHLPTPPGFRRQGAWWIPQPVRARIGLRAGGGVGSGRLWVRTPQAGFSAPDLQAVSPSTIDADTTTPISLLGTFPETPSSVTVGGTACTGISKISVNRVDCTAPAKAAASYDVVVTCAAGSDTLTAGLTYGTPAAGDEYPHFGDDAGDVLIFEDDFEGYASTDDLRASGGGPYDLAGTATVLETADPAAGFGGSAKNILMEVPAGTTSLVLSRTFTGTTRLFYQFQAKFSNEFERGKFLIIYTTATGGGCGGRPVTRWEGLPNQEAGIFVGHDNAVARLTSRGVYPGGGCDGWVSSTGPSTQDGYFLVPGYPGGWDPQEPVPCFSNDPLIDDTPWGAIDDGAYHEFHLEFQMGAAGTAYWILGLDGFVFWDCTGQTDMALPGSLYKIKYDTVSGDARTVGCDVRLDSSVCWRR